MIYNYKDKSIEVASIKEAVILWAKTRGNRRSSYFTSFPTIQDGENTYFISYNGRVWDKDLNSDERNEIQVS